MRTVIGICEVCRLATVRQSQVSKCLFIYREETCGCAVFRRHVRYRCAVSYRQTRQAGAEELDQFLDDTVSSKHLGHGEHKVGGRRAFRQRAGQSDSDDLRNEHVVRLPKHHSLCLDTADTPCEHAKAIDHRRMGVRANAGVRVCNTPVFAVLCQNRWRQIFEVYLMNDPRSRRYDSEVIERPLCPPEQQVTLPVSVKFALNVHSESAFVCEVVDLYRVIDHEIGAYDRIHDGRITARLGDCVTH